MDSKTKDLAAAAAMYAAETNRLRKKNEQLRKALKKARSRLDGTNIMGERINAGLLRVIDTALAPH